MADKYLNILKSTSLFGGVHGFNAIVNLVRTKIVAVLLGTNGVGLSSIYNTAIEMIRCVGILGVDTSGIRKISSVVEENQKEGHLKREICIFRSWILCLSIFGTLLTLILSPALSYLTFQNNEHIKDFLFLSPCIGLSIFSSGEMAVLKATRKLKELARTSLITTIVATLVIIPFYYYLGMDGVLPAIAAVFLVNLVVVIFFSGRQFKMSFSFGSDVFASGFPLVKLGFVLMLTNLLDNGVQILVQSGLNWVGGLNLVGLFRTNVVITSMFTGFFLSSISTDYYPRLSGIFNDREKRIDTVRRQSEFLMMIVPPALVVMLFALPVITPLLLSKEFLDVVPFTQFALVGVLFSAVHLPFTYSSLSAGDTRYFFVLNTVQSVDMLLVLLGYKWDGLTGMGLMLMASNILDFASSLFLARVRYGITMSSRMRVLFACQLLALLLSLGTVNVFTGPLKWLLGVLILIISVITSLTYKKYENFVVGRL